MNFLLSLIDFVCTLWYNYLVKEISRKAKKARECIMCFKNEISGEVLSHKEFVLFVWSEAKRQFTECHNDENWCDLTQDEQILIYCEQYEHQVNSRDWAICE